jgi:hypothetical protein
MVRQAPKGPVKELGNMLPFILDFMASVPANECIQFSKMDLVDGYWRMVVEPEAQWNFAYVMPSPPNEPIQLLVIPSALQMGWNCQLSFGWYACIANFWFYVEPTSRIWKITCGKLIPGSFVYTLLQDKHIQGLFLVAITGIEI